MCTSPIHNDGKVFVCRTCNECLAARRNDWVARACAEMEVTPHTYRVELTYRDIAGEKPDGALVLNYSHVRTFLDSLRAAYFLKYGARGEVRFMAVGELGSKKARAHWHLVLFSQKPLDVLGSITAVNTGRPQPMTMGVRQHWSLWPHGHVFFGAPTASGMRYVIKYIMKDQFNQNKSAGTTREHKSQNYGSSLFRMSKRPPIGQKFIDQKLQKLRDMQSLPLNLEIKVPSMGGFWYPKGFLREKYLEGLHDINATIREATGADAPQFKSLLRYAENSLDPKDEEFLLNGTKDQERPQEVTGVPEGTRKVLSDGNYRAPYHGGPNVSVARAAAETVEKCGGPLPCEECLAILFEDEVRKAYKIRDKSFDAFKDRNPGATLQDYEKAFRSLCRPAPYCLEKKYRSNRAAFAAERERRRFAESQQRRRIEEIEGQRLNKLQEAAKLKKGRKR